MNLIKNTFTGLVLITLGTLLGVVFTEVLLRALKQKPINSCHSLDIERIKNFNYSTKFKKYEPEKVMPICNNSDFKIFSKSNKDGYLGYSKKHQEPILVFGDSFAYGYGIQQDNTISAKLGAYNAGLWGKSFDDHSLVFQEVTMKHHFKKAVWFIYAPHLISISPPGWKTKNNINKKEKPFLYSLIAFFNTTEVSSLLLKTLGVGWNRTDYYTPEWSLFNKDSDRAKTGYKKFTESLLEIKTHALKKSIELYFLIIPSKNELRLLTGEPVPFFNIGKQLDANLPKKNLSSIILDMGFPKSSIIEVRDILKNGDEDLKNWEQYYFSNDAHINEKGSTLVSQFLDRILTGE
ncbi:hypothetical protein [Halobacteriovorax marinus]|uniref:hypothetical protein n=1 Tax=Halobacteriovorax marinus TaxID=97084 RepID=UPI003A92E412